MKPKQDDDFLDYTPPLKPQGTVKIRIRQGKLPEMDWDY